MEASTNDYTKMLYKQDAFETKLDKFEVKLESFEIKMDRFEINQIRFEEKLDKLDQRFQRMEEREAAAAKRFDLFQQQMTELRVDVKQMEGSLNTKLSETKFTLSKWMFGYFVALAIMILGLAFKNH